MRKVLILAAVALTWISCDKNDKDVKPVFVKTSIPTDINKLFESKGDVESDTVWIYVQGGPTTEREYAPEEMYEDNTPVYPYLIDDLRIYPFQTQHLNPKVASSELLTLEAAKIESATTTEIVKKIVEHFNSQNKVVYLIGHSYGSLVVNDFLAKYGSIARKTISLNGRLDMDQVVWEGFAKGEEFLFDADGINPFLDTEADNTMKDKNMRKLAAGLGFNRYTELLANADLTNAIFVTAPNDSYVGDFTTGAIDLLKVKSEALFILPEGLGHSDIFEPELFEQLHDLIIEDN